MFLKVLLAGILACVVSFIITPFIIKFAHKIGALDNPDERKVHKNVMPRLGGLAIYLSFIITVLISNSLTKPLTGLLLGSTLIVFIGIIDDIKGLSPRIKLLGQISAALVAVYFGVKVQFLTNPFSDMIILGKLAIPVTVLWIVGVTNALNLVDGLDGLAAGIASIASLTMGVIAFIEGQFASAFLAIILFSSIIGFLKYNFHPAKIFMGDTGSMFLGFSLSIIAIEGLTKGATVISVFIPVVILGIPIFDTAFAIIRRFINGQPIFQADKQHLHHRLLDLGLSHKQTVLAIYFISIMLSASAVLLTKLSTEQGSLILIVISTAVLIIANRIKVKVVKNKVSHTYSKNNKFQDYGG